MVQHCENIGRSVNVVNLDPAAEHFNYPVLAGKLLLNFCPLFEIVFKIIFHIV